MYVCVCHAVSDGDIAAAVEEGARTMADLRRELNVARQCGRCGPCARRCLQQCLAAARPDEEQAA